MRRKRKQRFVPPHTRTAAPDEDKSGRSHDRMVASESLESGYNRKNKVRLFCFTVACGLLASCLFAGDDELVSGTNSRSGHAGARGVVSIVRVGSDGRLVRVLTAPSFPKPSLKPEAP